MYVGRDGGSEKKTFTRIWAMAIRVSANETDAGVYIWAAITLGICAIFTLWTLTFSMATVGRLGEWAKPVMYRETDIHIAHIDIQTEIHFDINAVERNATNRKRCLCLLCVTIRYCSHFTSPQCRIQQFVLGILVPKQIHVVHCAYESYIWVCFLVSLNSYSATRCRLVFSSQLCSLEFCLDFSVVCFLFWFIFFDLFTWQNSFGTHEWQ